MLGVLAQEGGPLDVVFKSFDNTALWVILGISLVALVFAYYLVREVLAAPEGTDKMKEIAKAIQEGASRVPVAPVPHARASSSVLIGVALFFVLPVARGRRALGLLDPVRPFDRVHPGRRVLRGHRATWACGSRCARTSAPRTPRASPACGRP